MKKQFGFLAGVTLIALASCSDGINIDNPYKPVNETIEFANFVDNSGTRASKGVGYTFNEGEKIAVYGFENNAGTENQIFDNQEVTNTAGQNNQVWAYSPKKYWTTGCTYEFYSAYPYEQPFVFDAATKWFSLDNFTVDNDTAKQVDLMIAERNYATPNNVVELTFHHILSNVNFLAKVSPDVNPEEITSVDIVSLDIEGLLRKGSYAQTAWTANHQAEGAWTNPAPVSKSDYFDFPGVSGGKSVALKVGGDKPTPIATDMLLMPQKLFYVDDPATGISAEMDPVLKVSFKVSYVDNTSQVFERSLRLSSLKSYVKKTLQADGSYTSQEVSDPIYQWLPNYKYTYLLSFNPAKTTRVWSADSDGSIDGDQDGEGYESPEKGGGSRYNPDKPNVIEVLEGDEWVEYPVVWEDIDGDGKLEGGIDKDGDGHIDNVDGDNDTEYDGDDKYDPTDGDDVNNPDGKDVILVYVDADGDGEPDTWVQLEKDPETGEITPGKETEENFIEFTAVVADWEVEYGVNWEITK